MSVIVVGSLALLTACLWLVALVATDYSVLSLSVGLLAAVYIMGRST